MTFLLRSGVQFVPVGVLQHELVNAIFQLCVGVSGQMAMLQQVHAGRRLDQVHRLLHAVLQLSLVRICFTCFHFFDFLCPVGAFQDLSTDMAEDGRPFFILAHGACVCDLLLQAVGGHVGRLGRRFFPAPALPAHHVGRMFAFHMCGCNIG